jgi:1,2-diacylglycerol 3-alpha-glucosyltransferase
VPVGHAGRPVWTVPPAAATCRCAGRPTRHGGRTGRLDSARPLIRRGLAGSGCLRPKDPAATTCQRVTTCMGEAATDQPDPLGDLSAMSPQQSSGLTVWIFGDLPLGAPCGPSYMVESWTRELSLLGATTRLFTPSGSWRRRTRTASSVTFRTLRHIGFSGDHHARFSSLVQLWRAGKELPDVILTATPGRVGVLGATLAARHAVPLVVVESTDITGAMAHYGTARMLASGGSKPAVLIWAAPRMRAALRGWPRRAGRSLFSGPILATFYAEALRGLARDVVWLSTKSFAGRPVCDGGPVGVVIPAGIDRLPEASAPSELRWPPGALRVLYVGRLTPEKSLEVLVDALRVATDAGVDVHLTMTGGGHLAGALRAHAARLGVEDRLSLIGPFERSRLGGIFASADVFAFPSVVETQAFVLNEAAHEGLPLLVSDPDVNPVVCDGQSALVVPHDARAYAEALGRLRDPHLRDRLGACAARRAQSLREPDQAARLAAVLCHAVNPTRLPVPSGSTPAASSPAIPAPHRARGVLDAAPTPVVVGRLAGRPDSGRR